MAPNPDRSYDAEASSRLADLPVGSFTGIASGRRYVISKTLYNGGRSTKLVAEELGGTDYISLNLYDLASGPRLFPCELPRAKVIAFLRALRVTDQDAE